MQSLDPKAQSRFLDLRRQLTDCNYGGTFEVVSMDVVQHLLGIVTTTTGSYQELQDKETRLSSDLALAQAQLFPLRKDNSRLTRENHQLHVDNIRQTDASSNMFAEQNVNIRKLQDDLAEMNLVVKMKAEECNRMEVEKERLREAYEELADPSMKASKGAKRMLKMTSALPPKGKVSGRPRSGSDASSSFVAGSNADEAVIIDSLRRQLDEAHAAIKSAADDNARLQAAVNAREMELARSTRASDLEDAGTTKAEQLANADASNKRIIDQLNGQVDFLNEQLALREAQLVESASKIIRADEISLEFTAKSNMCETLQAEVAELNAALRASDLKVVELTEALEPGGNVSVDELFDSNASRSKEAIMSLLQGGDSSTASSANSGSRGSFVAMPEQTRSSRGASRKASAAAADASSSFSYSADDTAAMAAMLAKEEAKIIAEQRRITSAPRSGRSSGVPDTVLTKREHDSIVSQLLAEKAGLVEDCKALNERLESSHKGDSIVMQRMKTGEERVAALQEELDEAESALVAIGRQVKSKDEYLAIREAECLELQRKLSEVSAKLGSSSHNSSEMEWKANNTQAILDETIRERDTAQSLAERLRSEISTLRRERIDVISARDEANDRLRITERDLSNASAAADKANRELLSVKSEMVQGESTVDQLTSDASSYKRKLEHAERMLSATQANLNSNKAELTEALNSLAMYQMSASPGNVADTLRADCKALQQKVALLEEEKDALQVDTLRTKEKLSSLVSMRSVDEQVAHQSTEDRAALMCDIDSKNDMILGLQKTHQRLELEVDRLQTKLSASEMTCDSMRASARDREYQSHASLNTSQQLSSDVTMLTRRCVDAEEAYTVARRQSENDQQALLRSTERCNAADRQVANLTDLLTTCQQDVETNEMQVLALKKQLDASNRHLSAERDDNNRNVDREKELAKQVADLKTLLSNNEKSVRTQALKNTGLLHTLNDGEENAQRLGMEITALRNALQEKDNREADLQEVIKNLDDSRDTIQNQLDSEQEARAVQDQTLRALEQKNLQLRQALEQAEKKMKNASNEMNQSQNNVRNLDGRLKTLKDENLELKRRYGMKNADVAGAAEDLMLMTKENQALTAELADTAGERDRLRYRVSEIMQKMASIEQSRRALEVERQDLLDTYRSVLSEKRAMENELSALGATKQRTGASVQNMNGQIAEMKGLINSHSVTEKRWAQERSNQLKQLEAVNDELIRTKKGVESCEADNRRLMNDTHALRQTNSMLNERVQMVIKRATSAADANKVLSSRLSSVERERDAVRALINAERQRAEDYGTIAETARAQVASRESELQRLRNADQSAYSGNNDSGVYADESQVTSTTGIRSSAHSSSASSAAAAAAALNSTLGLSEDDSTATPPPVPASRHSHRD